MKINDVLTDKVIELGVVSGLPVRVKVITRASTQILMARNVTDRRIQPDVKILAGVARYFESKVGGVPRNIPVL